MNIATSFRSKVPKNPIYVEHKRLYDALYGGILTERVCDNMIKQLNKIYGAYNV